MERPSQWLPHHRWNKPLKMFSMTLMPYTSTQIDCEVDRQSDISFSSAVSALIIPNTSGQHRHSSYSSYNSWVHHSQRFTIIGPNIFRSHNSFGTQRQYQQQGSPATYTRPHYSQSFVSQDSLSTECSPLPFEINGSRQPVLQPPARPSSSYSMSSNYQTFNASSYQYMSGVPGNMDAQSGGLDL